MSATIRCISPIDGSVYAERPAEPVESVRAKLGLARKAQKAWAAVPLDERIALVREGVARLDRVNADLVTELAWQMGRPVRYGGEMGGVRERTAYMAGIAERALAPEVIEDSEKFRRVLVREPAGVVLVIAPWNYPFLTAINTIVPGLIAGNAILLKHATQTLLVGERLAMAFRKAGLPDGLFQNLVLSHSQTEKLIASGAIDHVNFTGSVEGGRKIERAAAGTFATLGLELGGKDPAYVRADVKLDHAIENIVDGAFYNSGQCCCGVERIYAHADVYDQVVEGVIELTKKYVVGNPLDAATTMGPMASPRFADLVREQTAEALRKGARANIGMKIANDRPGSPYLAPEVLTGVNHQMAVMREESFGPVVGIMKVADDEEAIQLMNDSPYGLTASIWTRDTDAAAAIGARVETGTVYMNRCDYLDPALVWTGVKETGKGASLSEIGYHNLTRPKSFHLREV
jgi:acyl-CoA reductase-like NAD-dependent aldehyde dehydrogenase